MVKKQKQSKARFCLVKLTELFSAHAKSRVAFIINATVKAQRQRSGWRKRYLL